MLFKVFNALTPTEVIVYGLFVFNVRHQHDDSKVLCTFILCAHTESTLSYQILIAQFLPIDTNSWLYIFIDK